MLETSTSVSSLTSEKLGKTNYPAWKFHIKNFLMGKDLWDIVSGAEAEPAGGPNEAAVKAWVRKAHQAIHYMSITIDDNILGHIQDKETAKDVWDAIAKMYETSTKARKLQLLQELHSVKQQNISIQDYVLEIRKVLDQLGSIVVVVDDDDVLRACMNGLRNEYKQFKTSIRVRENIPSFNDLIFLMISEELRLIQEGLIPKNHGNATTTQGGKQENLLVANISHGRG